MTDSTIPNLTLSSYKAGRFEYLLREPFARELWGYLSDKKSISLMLDAAGQGKPPLWPLLDHIENRFGTYIASDRFPDDDVEVMVNNMIKQIMEYAGYEHAACGMLRHARYIRLSGVYEKQVSTTTGKY